MTSEREIGAKESTKLILLESGPLTLGLEEGVILEVIKWTEPTPLPFSPEVVLGIVSVQGRMFTVVDVARLFDREPAIDPKLIVALRGDEQLALAVDCADREANYTQLENNPTTTLAKGIARINGKEIEVIDHDQLFAGVIRGRERRKRRL